MSAVCRNLWYVSLDCLLISRPRIFNTWKTEIPMERILKHVDFKGPHSPKMHCVPLSLNSEFRVTRNFQKRERPFTIVFIIGILYIYFNPTM